MLVSCKFLSGKYMFKLPPASCFRINFGKHDIMLSKADYIYLPVVTRFFWPPEIPRCIWSPTMVSAQMSSPSICTKNNLVRHPIAIKAITHLKTLVERH